MIIRADPCNHGTTEGARCCHSWQLSRRSRRYLSENKWSRSLGRRPLASLLPDDASVMITQILKQHHSDTRGQRLRSAIDLRTSIIQTRCEVIFRLTDLIAGIE